MSQSLPLLIPCPDSPAALGYRFPAEWEPHAATWLAWPHNPATWPGKFEPIPAVWQELVRTLAQFEPVNIFAGGESIRREAESLVGDVPNVTLCDIPTNDVWSRDHGPMFLAGPPDLPPALVDWDYNAWGGKYPPFDLDNEIPRHVAELTGRRRFTPGIILEGGAIDGDGAGTILTTEPCLLNPNRNPHLGRGEIEQYLADYCAARKVIWLAGEIAGDDTDGHIDELARFVGPRTVVCAVEPDPQDENYEPLADNFQRLASATDAQGRAFEVVPINLPRPLYHDGQRLPASYMNFYIANGVVLVPVFDDVADLAACDTLGALFPGRKIHPLRAVDLAWGLGAYHCITQQQPARSAK
ncbi:MAG TPA: agmatine deiminase family protein [Pirellulales bacterium]|jgi:agmatine deiminase|nr:agmatine deiminase family protein [Pirellulales bacterium]